MDCYAKVTQDYLYTSIVVQSPTLVAVLLVVVGGREDGEAEVVVAIFVSLRFALVRPYQHLEPVLLQYL